MKKIINQVLFSVLIASALVMGPLALAASNPSGNGQPGASCGAENALVEPNGFGTGGFAIAESKYAGSDGTASKLHAKSSNAVSQYDVACYQLSNN